MGCFGFRLKFGRRGFGVLRALSSASCLALASASALALGFGLQAGLFLGFLFGLLFSFEFGFFLVRQGVSIGGLFGGRVSRFVRFGLLFFGGRFLVGRGGVLVGSCKQGPRGKACAQQPGHHEQGEAPKSGTCEKTLQGHGVLSFINPKRCSRLIRQSVRPCKAI